MTPVCAIGLERLFSSLAQHRVMWSPRILYLRERYRFGPTRITSYLHRFHSVDGAPSTAHRILIRYGMNACLPIKNASRQAVPGNPATDCKSTLEFLERIAGSRIRLYQFTAFDDFTESTTAQRSRKEYGSGIEVSLD
jgi:hypothetical protein